ncbi:molybdopterin-dependent oxidoreductase [Streptosporangium vulgare]|uniref:molybdopterin-dependent oxidoreductase n=1 Tax=Streptosporangium vulgare TaxID=46190 RepID=UPI0031DE2130
MRTAHRTCPLCEAVCGLRLTLDDAGHVTSVKGDRDDPFSKGFICPKGATLGHLDEDPDRLRVPMIRTGGEWREASWDEAFRTVAEGLTGVIDAHGRQSLAVYLGNPNAHSMAGALYGGALIRALGTRNVFSASTADQMPKHVSCGLMLGDPLAIAVPDLDRTDYLLMLGANPLESNGSLCTAPDFPGRLKALRGRGGKLVVVDPRRTRTAALADEHLFVRPGTDAYLLFGIVHTLLAEDLTSADIGAGIDGVGVNGLEEVRRLAEDFAPEAVAPMCGVPAEEIVRLARELAAAPDGRRLRPHRHLHRGVRHRRAVAGRRRQRPDRQLRPSRRGHVRQTRRGERPPEQAVRHGTLAQPRPGGCRRRTASSRWPPSPTRSRRRARDRSGGWSRWPATRCCRRRAGPGWTGPSVTWSSWSAWTRT